MKRAVISGDIVAFTSLSNELKEFLEKRLQALTKKLEPRYNTYARLIKGDFLECVVPNPEDALVVALLIKSWVKAVPIQAKKKDKRIRYFETYGIRLAIGYGTLDRFDREKDTIDGEAIYMSGRKINEEGTHGKERITIKKTLFFVSADDPLNKAMEPLMALVDHTMNKATAKQCEVLHYKLLGDSEAKISRTLGISQPVVNQHSTSVGWSAIEKAVDYFHQRIKEN